MEKHFAPPNISNLVSGAMREVLDNDTTAREKVSLNGLGMTKGQFEGVSMMLKTGMKVDQYYTSFKNVPPIP